MNEFRTELKTINSKMIVSCKEYQRDVDYSRVARIVKNYNPNLVNPIKVSFRGGKYYVFDGQHTLEAAKTRNGNKDLPVLCKVFYGMKLEDEARLFSEQNGIVNPVSSAYKMNALYVAGDVDVTAFKYAVESMGIKCNFKNCGKADRNLQCYKTAFGIYMKHGEDHLKSVLGVIMAAWGGVCDALVKEVVSGLSVFMLAYDGEYDEKKLIDRLKRVSPIAITRDGKATTTGGNRRFAIQILNAYNKGTSKGRLESKF